MQISLKPPPDLQTPIDMTIYEIEPTKASFDNLQLVLFTLSSGTIPSLVTQTASNYPAFDFKLQHLQYKPLNLYQIVLPELPSVHCLH